MKKYLNINEVSKALDIKVHIIRYWDSIDPKTNELRIDGLSTKTKGGTRYFNKENIERIKKLKNILYNNGDHNYPLKIVNKYLSGNKTKIVNSYEDSYKENINYENIQKINQILKKLRLLVK